MVSAEFPIRLAEHDMSASSWMGFGMGTLLGVGYVIASYLAVRWASRFEGGKFVKVFVGSMVVRMMVALALVAVVLSSKRIDGLFFVGSFLLLFIAGVIVEVMQLHGVRTSR